MSEWGTYHIQRVKKGRKKETKERMSLVQIFNDGIHGSGNLYKASELNFIYINIIFFFWF